MSSIIRVLWGADGPGQRFSRVWRRDIVKSCLKREDLTNYHVYIYGEDNYVNLLALGFTHVHLIDKRPFPSWADRRVKGMDIRPWRYKIELIREAMKDHDRIIYCDWDVEVRVDAKDAFEMLEGRELVLSLVAYARPRKLWGRTVRNPEEAVWHPNRCCVSGNWMHIVGPDWPNQVLEEMDEGPAGKTVGWHDEYAMTKLLAQRHGGWPGEKYWLEHYESPLIVQKPFRCCWGMKVQNDEYVERETIVPFRWLYKFVPF